MKDNSYEKFPYPQNTSLYKYLYNPNNFTSKYTLTMQINGSNFKNSCIYLLEYFLYYIKTSPYKKKETSLITNEALHSFNTVFKMQNIYSN